MATLQVIVLTILVFFVIVSIHEWGHYYFAKRAGILIREFAIGFGPKLFSMKRGETRYTIRLIPAGGFVRMAGEDPEQLDMSPGNEVSLKLNAAGEVTHIYNNYRGVQEGAIVGTIQSIDVERNLSITILNGDVTRQLAIVPTAEIIDRNKSMQIAPLDRQFASKSIGARAMAIFAGPFMNFVLAFVLIFIVLQASGVPNQLRIEQAAQGKPAAEAGVKQGDLLLAINGEQLGTDYERMSSLIEQSAGVPMTFTVQRGTDQVDLKVIPALDPSEQVGKAGIAIGYTMRDATILESIQHSSMRMVDLTVLILDGFKQLITGQFAIEDLGGPVRTAQVTSQIAQQGFIQLLSWTAILSLYLGIFNLLPIPALDGSRLIFIAIEAVRRKPISQDRESMVHFIGFAMLMLLMVFVTYHDIVRLVRGES